VAKADKKETVHNPEYDSWIAKYQQSLSYLLNSLTKEAFVPVTTVTASAKAWQALEEMFSASSKARVTNLRMKLATLKKGSMPSSVRLMQLHEDAMEEEVVVEAVATTTTSAEAWQALEEMFSASSKAWVTNVRMKLATLKKGSMSSSVYFTKMWSICDELATIGKTIDNNEMIHYILTGLDSK
jgi:hypothetical protein